MRRARTERGWPRVWVSLALLGASPLAARATGLDGAGQVMIVPLVFTGGDRESTVTLANAHVQPASVSVVYVGAEGTRHAASGEGEIACTDQQVPVRGSVSRRLRDLCPGIHEADVENFGYLVVTVRVDPPAVGRLFVETVVEGRSGITGGITGQPVGTYNPALPSAATLGLEVGGLRTRTVGERPVCFVASLDERKAVDLDLRDAAGARLGSTVSLALDPRRMERIDLQSRFGLALQDRDELRLTAVSSDGAQVVLGCGAERPASFALAYQPARSPDAGDASRLHSATVQMVTKPGPYQIGIFWAHTAVGWFRDVKVTLSTYVRAEDEVRCLLQPWPGYEPPTDTTSWIEIQLRDPLGKVVAGGSSARSFVYRTPPRGRLPVGTSQEYFIEISFDENASAAWPSGVSWGPWQIACESGAGMSEPIVVPAEYLDDF